MTAPTPERRAELRELASFHEWIEAMDALDEQAKEIERLRAVVEEVKRFALGLTSDGSWRKDERYYEVLGIIRDELLDRLAALDKEAPDAEA
jgi:hypothetical protein